MKLYLDTNVFISCWTSEFRKRIIPAGYYAEKLLEKIINEDMVLVISDLTIIELEKVLPISREQILGEYLRPYQMCNKLQIVKITPEKKEMAKKFRIHFPDNFHLAVAKQEKAVLVTDDEELLQIAHESGVTALHSEQLLL